MTSEARLREATEILDRFFSEHYAGKEAKSFRHAFRREFEPLLATSLEAARREARLEALEEAAKIVLAVPTNLEGHWELQAMDYLLLKAIAGSIRALASRAAPLGEGDGK
jgi:hypothetical protein